MWMPPLVLFLRLSSASFVSCAAAMGGEKAAASMPKSTRGSKKERGIRHGQEGGAGAGSKRDLGRDAKQIVPVDGGVDEDSETPCFGRRRPVDAAELSTTGREETSTMGVDAVAAELTRRARVPVRRASAPLYFAFDHCFSLRGVGTILTGTVLTGEVKASYDYVCVGTDGLPVMPLWPYSLRALAQRHLIPDGLFVMD